MLAPGTLALIALFVVGVVTVIYSVEVFIEAVTQSAVSLGISGFFLAVLLAGVDLENAVLGVTAAFVELPDLALGTVFGEALFVLAVAVGVAGILIPFRVDVPRTYLVMLLVVPIPAFLVSIDGSVRWIEGAALTGGFVPLLGYIYWYERRAEAAYLRSGEVEEVIGLEAETDLEAEAGLEDGTSPGTERRREAEDATDGGGPDGVGPADEARDRMRAEEAESDRWNVDLDLDLDELVPELEHRSGVFNLGVSVLAVIGLTLGSLLTVFSAEGIFVAFGISGLAFGATVLSFIASIEELALTVEPVRRNRPGLAVGNVVGSTVFYATANVGLIGLVHSIDTTGAVMTVHWPFFGACLLVATAMLARGRVTRVGGFVLLGLYVAYWIANYA